MTKDPQAFDAVAVSLVTGFPGSGKTTLMKHLLQDPRLVDAAVIVNEFGEVGLDHQLMEPGGQCYSAANACAARSTVA
jgi:G3E family GTPase